MTRPLVSVVTLTLPERKPFLDALGRSIGQFSVTPDEWIIEEGPETVGEKRQRAIARARGDIVVFMDDDDFQHPDRLKKQVEALTSRHAQGTLVATRRFFVHDIRTGRTVRCALWQVTRGAPPAGSMAFWRKPALEIGFKPGAGTEKQFCDAWEQKAYGHFYAHTSLYDMRDPSLYILVRHGSNVSPDSWCWTEDDILGDELATAGWPGWQGL